MKMDWQHYVLFFGTPLVTAFVDCLVNSNTPFSKATLSHAALATGLVAVALLKQAPFGGLKQAPWGPAAAAPGAPTASEAPEAPK